MLNKLIDDTLHWTCTLYDRDGEWLSCGQEKSAHLGETRFVQASGMPVQERGIARLATWAAAWLAPAWAHRRDSKGAAIAGSRGAVIALPRCSCGVQTFLKADYSLKEVWQCCVPLVSAEGQVWAYGLRYGHLHNLLAHALHYQAGNAPAAPVLPMPPDEMLRGEMPPDVLHALWFGWLAYREYGSQQRGVPALSPLPQLLMLPESTGVAQH